MESQRLLRIVREKRKERKIFRKKEGDILNEKATGALARGNRLIERLREERDGLTDKNIDILIRECKGKMDEPGSAFGFTPLMEAAKVGNAYAVKRLLENGADVRKREWEGWTPLHFAMIGPGDEKIADDLLKYGAEIDEREEDGWTPLLLAVYNDHFDRVRYLIKKGADVNLPDIDGVSPMARAFERELLDMARMLAEAGAAIDEMCIEEVGYSDCQDLWKVVMDYQHLLTKEGRKVFKKNRLKRVIS